MASPTTIIKTPKTSQNYKFGPAMEDLTWKTKNPFNQREHIHTHTTEPAEEKTG